MNRIWAVFTKPWKMPIPELGAHVRSLGFDSIELPVRPGYPVNPDNMTNELPRAVAQLAECGVGVASIAGPTDERSFAACATAVVPIVRICVGIGPEGYLESEARLQREYDRMVPLLERYGVTLGVQNHCDRSVCNAMGLRSLIGRYPPAQIGAVWDAAHNALNGEDPEMALDIVWSHLCMVNLKNAFWKPVDGPEAEHVRWRPYWTSGRHGLASWPRVAAELMRRGYTGPLCLPAEYTDEESVDRLAAADLEFAKSLFV